MGKSLSSFCTGNVSVTVKRAYSCLGSFGVEHTNRFNAWLRPKIKVQRRSGYSKGCTYPAYLPYVSIECFRSLRTPSVAYWHATQNKGVQFLQRTLKTQSARREWCQAVFSAVKCVAKSAARKLGTFVWFSMQIHVVYRHVIKVERVVC